LADFQAAAKMTPTDPEPLILQGLCYDKIGQSAKAEDAWRAALRIDADAPEPHYRLGRMELDRAKPTAAIEHFRKAVAKASEESTWRADATFPAGPGRGAHRSQSSRLGRLQEIPRHRPAECTVPPRSHATGG
jgi:Flp pilus assembly protein TadD